MAESKGDTLQKILVFLGIASCTFVLGVNGALFRSMRTRDANTRRAIQNTRNFHSAQIVYSVRPGKGNFTDNPLDLCSGSKCFINDLLMGWQGKPVDGYIMVSIKTTPKTSEHESTYSMVIVPEVRTGLFRTGNDCFYVDQTGEIRHSGSPTIMPDANSPVIPLLSD